MRDFLASTLSPGRLHLSLRTLAANDNVPLEFAAVPRRVDGAASTRWPLLDRIGRRRLAATLEAGSRLVAGFRRSAGDASQNDAPAACCTAMAAR